MKYEAEAAVTESPQFYGELLQLSRFESDMAGAIYAMRRLDVVKKLLFYGKKDKSFRSPISENSGKVPALFFVTEGKDSVVQTLNEVLAVRIIHGVLGVVTEACEMLELMHRTITEHKPFDSVNLMEESGDVFWYLACLSNATGITFEEVQRINIAKLRKRYPNKFTEFDAINRNTEAERAVLEQKPDAYKCVDGVVTVESDAEMLKRLGTNGDLWASEFVSRFSGSNEPDLDDMRAWFANAIEAGKQSQKRDEVHVDIIS